MMTIGAAPSRTIGERLISARMLVLQSKRLLLASSQRRLRDGQPQLSNRVKQLTLEASEAQHSYRTTIMAWGPEASSQYWPVAYSRLVEVGEVLAAQLRGATRGMQPEKRFEMATEVEALEDFIKGWRATLQKTMAPSEG